MKSLASCFLYFILCSNWSICRPRMVTFLHDCQSYLWPEISLIYQYRSLGMVLLYAIYRCCCYLYLLHFCDGCEHHLVLSRCLVISFLQSQRCFRYTAEVEKKCKLYICRLSRLKHYIYTILCACGYHAWF